MVDIVTISKTGKLLRIIEVSDIYLQNSVPEDEKTHKKKEKHHVAKNQ